MIQNESMDSGKFRMIVLLQSRAMENRWMFLDNADENEKLSPLMQAKIDHEPSVNDVNEQISLHS